jgi:antitoxin VapB
MALYVKDEEADRMAQEVQAAYGMKTKTEAVKMALQKALDQAEEKLPLEQRLKAIQDRVKKLGTPDPNFDDKAYFDEMWGM